jgi:hypothetical protein
LPYGNANEKLDEPFLKADVAYVPPCRYLGSKKYYWLLIEHIDEPKALEGLPAHVQIMGKPMKDEELMEISRYVEKALST